MVKQKMLVEVTALHVTVDPTRSEIWKTLDKNQPKEQEKLSFKNFK